MITEDVAPLAVGERGQVIYPGGITVEGNVLRIPGRALDHAQLEEAEQHARSVLAAVAVLREL